MRHLIEPDLTKEIMDVTVCILKENFNYDLDTAQRFCNALVARLNQAHIELMANTAQDFKREIWADPDARLFFTISFTGFHISKTLKEVMDFDFEELNLFNNLISKYIRIEENPF